MATSSSNFLVSESHLQLNEARKLKSERIKDIGSPIELAGKALDIKIEDGCAWIAENTAVARKLDLESGKTLQLYRGHKGPVTCLALVKGHVQYLITGSWDKSINVWNTNTKELISTTPNAHTDFVKSLVVIPAASLLLSSGSDRLVRCWDISALSQTTPLRSVGLISAHTRPVECLAVSEETLDSVTIYTADTMGLVKRWKLTRSNEVDLRWRATLLNEYNYHRTGVNDIWHGAGQLWTASSDDTVQLLADPTSGKTQSIPHATAVKALLHLGTTDVAEPYLLTGAGDTLLVWDVADVEHPELIKEVDAHWHDVTAIRFWKRKSQTEDAIKIEPWILTTSLDGTIRRWKLIELLTPQSHTSKPEKLDEANVHESEKAQGFEMTAEEQRELDELMDD